MRRCVNENKKRDIILNTAIAVFDGEISALIDTRNVIGISFISAVEQLMLCRGKIIITGVGKSGLIARKIAATLSSTGSTAIFVHPVDCLHGDMGMIDIADVVVILSKSGESEEIRRLLTFLKNRNIKVIAVTARSDSFLAHSADIAIPFVAADEACPMGLAPMASTTAQLAVGDALAAALIRLKDFKPEDFAIFHPAGSIGKRLLLKVSDIMHVRDDIPVTTSRTCMREALVMMTEKPMGALLVATDDDTLLGIITEGDLRRGIQKYPDLLVRKVSDLMTPCPITVTPETMAIDALHLMENRNSQISVLPVMDRNSRIQGMIRLHDLVIAGLY